MFKRLFSRSSEKKLAVPAKRDEKPIDHNHKEFSRLLDAFKVNNPACDALSTKELERKFQQFADQHRLGVDLRSSYISHCSPERLQRLLESSYYKATIANGIKKIEQSDKDFSWAADKGVVGSLFMDRGFFIIVRAVNRKVGFTRRWVFDMHIATKHFA
ncbi:hypothetical protein MAQ5080_03411 [Marinomonas aquimarina]|uniref:Uncharacterized protein n=1 Tax=Marinomonas aquimarina TaxID=295068 RepID=A0A1A8TPT7_9GAMM|nr:hypothetical protein [Marinomonas aquimarina]SBS36278.1 hypothetical protein MAQ5080_03411 [Marinomonas aquimarina]